MRLLIDSLKKQTDQEEGTEKKKDDEGANENSTPKTQNESQSGPAHQFGSSGSIGLPPFVQFSPFQMGNEEVVNRPSYISLYHNEAYFSFVWFLVKKELHRLIVNPKGEYFLLANVKSGELFRVICNK